MQERKRLEESIGDDQRIASLASDLDTLFELAREGENVDGDIARELKTFSEVIEKIETAMLLSGENDARSAIVTIHPGAGGTESQDWAEMLLRMYLRWAERLRFNTVVTDRLEGEGAGINMTDSAVRITHFPTGIVVQCQNERSQHKNRDSAMKQLRARMYEFELEKKREETRKTEASKLDINFGSQIRSYVLAPYRMIKDHRTKLSIGDVDRVLGGDLDALIHAYLVFRKTGKTAGDGKDELPE